MSTSALLKSAAATRASIENYNDALAAFTYENSGYTDDAYQVYSDYLKNRIDSLTSDTTITGANKVLSLTKTLDTANKSNISATIQRENIQVLSGNATATDKYNVVAGQYVRAVNAGDLTLAQSLMGQAYSLSQQVQYEQQQSAAAATTLAGQTATQRISDIKASFQDLNSQIAQQGKGALDSSVAAWVKTHSDELKQMGVVLPSGVQPNYFDLVHGIQGYMYNVYQTAAEQVKATDPNAAQTYLNEAQNIANGTTKLTTLAGSLTSQDALQAAGNPNQYKFDPSQGKFVQTQQSGINQVIQPNGQVGVAPTYSNSVVQVINPQLNIQLKKLGLNYSTNSNGSAKTVGPNTQGVQVEATTVTDPAIKTILQKGGGVSTAYFNPKLGTNGGIQFQSDAATGTKATQGASGQAVYSVVYDKQGNKQVYESSNMGDALVYSDPAYNDGTNTDSSSGFSGSKANVGSKNPGNPSKNIFGGITSGISSLFNPHTSADQLPSGLQQPQYTGDLLKVAQTRSQAIAAQQVNLQAAAPALQGLPTVLPKLPAYQAPVINPQQISSSATISTKPVVNNSTISIAPQKPQGTFTGVSNNPNTGTISF